MPSTPRPANADTLAAIQSISTHLEQALNQSLTQRFEHLSKTQETHIKALVDASLKQLSDELLRISLNVSEAGKPAASNSSGEARLGSAIGRLITLAVSSALDGKKTSVSSSETDRSKQASGLKPSKSQEQAARSAQAQKGLRNL